MPAKTGIMGLLERSAKHVGNMDSGLGFWGAFVGVIWRQMMCGDATPDAI